MSFIFKALIVGCIAYFFFGAILADSRHADAQARRNEAQSALLVRLEAMHHPEVSLLVDEWRRAYPSPIDARLAELRVMAERLQADPASAKQFRVATKQAELDALPFSSPFGAQRARPGIGQ
ncbi:hypothetical protein [Cupriavidus basilensis]|uniref:Uncharacterized protein n=1 Tax=Cupriavidus basilensis TaxID=68895 RepID=A0A0C4YH83_9BURK|nr:hypothetical protein [Cupriavidus basilensis]AJG22343.1 hypothetical protein RR42_s0752 [Cupriavidus basilensis]